MNAMSDVCVSCSLVQMCVLINKLYLDIFEHWTRDVLLGTDESFQLRIEIADKHDIVRKVVKVTGIQPMAPVGNGGPLGDL